MDEATIKLHRLANDPLLEDVDKALDILASGKADVDYQHPRTGQTALMSASLGGKAKLVGLLIEHGADPLVPEMDGYTPVHGAGFQGRVAAMRALAKAGLDYENVHKDGYTPFHRACWGRNERHAELVAVMIDELGVDPFLPAQASAQADGATRGAGKTCRDMTANSRTLAVLDDREAKAKLAKLAELGSAEGEL